VKHPPILLQAAAIAVSVLLAGGFVSYRAGAFHWLTRPSKQPAPTQLGGTKSDRIEILPGSGAQGTTQDQTIMYSSKSGPAFTPGTAPPATAQSTAPPSDKKGPQP
jgi:hypothetical protein